MARDLAAHLVATADVELAERILRDARRDAERLAAPKEFWSLVTNEYDRLAQQLAVDVKDLVRTKLLSFGNDR